MPPKNKSKNTPNQHDKRHESGLAPPGKRVTRKQSNGQLNGQPNGKPVSSSPSSSALPTPGINHGIATPRYSDPSITALQAGAKDHVLPTEDTERGRAISDASLEEGVTYGEMGDVCQELASTAPGGEGGAPAYKYHAPTSTGSTLSSISTILSYYPLRDAISILILLLSLPPTLVLVIQTLFASLTFVPPTTSISLSTLPNIKEMFNSPNLGYPALATILIVDLIFWVCWLPVWKPIQGVFLDLSQAVIAVSLSGAAASSGGPTYSIATTTVIVCIVHVLRYKAIHLTALDYLRSVIHKSNIGTPLDVPSFATNFASLPPIDRGWLYTVIRTILGIHIVSQGVTTCIRRSLVKANEQSANVSAISKTDPEAAVGSEQSARSTTGPTESTQHPAVTSSTDGRPPGPSPARRDSKPRESASKKKRKQANQVRSQQPLWAAIASTKVTFVKEMEQRDAVDDAREASRMDTNTLNIIASHTNTTTDRIWICEVRDTEISFSVELSADAAMENVAKLEEGTSLSAGIDKSKPFYVRINHAAWSSTRILLNPTKDDPASTFGERYDGEIFGLAPMSSYLCEVVAIASQDILCSVSIITQPAPTPEQSVSTPSQPQHQALRPSSPITTLKQSIQTAEVKLNETRNRTKKTKKDQRAIHADIKREINGLKSKLDSSGGTDDRQERRLQQISQHKTQAEEATAELKEQMDVIGDIPRNEVAESEAKRSKWQSASDAKRAANRDLENAKAEFDRELSTLKSEIYQTESKREKLVTRHAQRSEELERLVSKQQADMTARQKRDFDRAQILHRREKEENGIRSLLAGFENEAEVYQQKTHDAYQQIGALQSWSSQQPPPYPGLPTYEDAAVASPSGALGSPQSNGFPTFGPVAQPFQSPFHSAHPSINNVPSAPRGRSSSMLSQYSGFTDNGEEYSFAPDPPRHQHSWPMQAHTSAGADRKESEGSGSASLNNGSTGSNSPRPEARPFIPGKAGVVGTIGPPSKAKQSPGAVGSGR
ncbi:hypothetical protein LTR37_014799 [Vermiconidia calcicola]|uniref:Uncharacterized protein n=1 Tax=Vermiconidia calcicola TaxID=1690605 RepID=A0ACC3MTZ2_9PEZI|nr:hypothetical protein LTR37_014799 [Vermiconidia calcicola]